MDAVHRVVQLALLLLAPVVAIGYTMIEVRRESNAQIHLVQQFAIDWIKDGLEVPGHSLFCFPILIRMVKDEELNGSGSVETNQIPINRKRLSEPDTGELQSSKLRAGVPLN